MTIVNHRDTAQVEGSTSPAGVTGGPDGTGPWIPQGPHTRNSVGNDPQAPQGGSHLGPYPTDPTDLPAQTWNTGPLTEQTQPYAEVQGQGVRKPLPGNIPWTPDRGRHPGGSPDPYAGGPQTLVDPPGDPRGSRVQDQGSRRRRSADPQRGEYGGPQPKRSFSEWWGSKGSGGSADRADADPRWLTALDLLFSIGLSLVVTAAAAVGQFGFAEWAGVKPGFRWMAPFFFEFAMVAFLLRGYIRARRGQSPVVPWVIALAIGGLSVYTNVVHTASYGEGLFFGSASGVCLVLWFAKLYDSYRSYLLSKGKIIVPIPKLGRNWWMSTRRAWRAMLIGTAINSDDVAECLRLAWRWQATYRSLRRSNKVNRKRKTGVLIDKPTMKLAAWNSVYEAVGMPTVELADVEIPELRIKPPQPLLVAEPAANDVPPQRMPDPEPQPQPRPEKPVNGGRERRQPEPTATATATRGTGIHPTKFYADRVDSVKTAYPDWETRKVSLAEGRAAAGCGQGTAQKIQMLVELDSPRRGDITAEAWADKFKTAEFPLAEAK